MRPNAVYSDRIVYIPTKQLRRLVAEEGPLPAKELQQLQTQRPKYRSECISGQRPCIWTACRFHLYLKVPAAGSLRFPRGDRQLEEMSETCALDVADRGPQELRDIAHLLGLTRQRVEQITLAARAKVAAALEPWLDGTALVRFFANGPGPKSTKEMT